MSDEAESGQGETRPRIRIVAEDFVPPLEFVTTNMVLTPLGPEHNESDHQAWMSSIDHITSTPGFGPPFDWPPGDGMTLERNRSDLVAHRKDFDDGVRFTYTVVDIHDRDSVIGCVYIYADPSGDYEIQVRSWVTKPGCTVWYLVGRLRRVWF